MKRDKVLSCLTRTAVITTVIRVIALLLMTVFAIAVLIMVVHIILPNSHQMAILETRINSTNQEIHTLANRDLDLKKYNEIIAVLQNKLDDNTLFLSQVQHGTKALESALRLTLTAYQAKLNYIQTQLNVSLLEIQKLGQEVYQNMKNISCPGSDPNQPASSCKQILDCNSSSSSGYYWIASEDGSTRQRHCSMNRVCGGLNGGWMRVAELDMRNSSSLCPSGLRKIDHSGQKLCGMNIDEGGCSAVLFEMHNTRYEQVCGKIIAYQFGSTDSFGLNHGTSPSENIDSLYVEGISLTYGSNPRKHIWTLAAALDEVGTYSSLNCPCTKIDFAADATPPPSFVGNDYFCDTGSNSSFTFVFYPDDPLWDGAGCGPANFCCSLNNPPWFFKQLQSSTSEDIEMRVCCDQNRQDEDVQIEQIELYVQ